LLPLQAREAVLAARLAGIDKRLETVVSLDAYKRISQDAYDTFRCALATV
jgi:hypothetical protein